jgi:rhodanese-related sulfurtransferase
VLDEHGFGHHGTGAAGTGKPGDRRQQVQNKDGQIAHRTIVARSQHAQRMLANFGIRHAQAALVESRKEGLFVSYRLSDPAIFALCTTIRTVAERQLADLERLVRDHFGDRSEAEAVEMNELLKRARSKRVVVLDTRPPNEYAAGHIAGAISVPVDDLQRRLRQLPKGKDYVAYCRGPYCVYADRAVEILRSNGRQARRLREGFPEWRAAGLPIEVSASSGA